MTPGQAITGASIIADWLGDGGKPVPAFESKRRAEICEICPRNQHPKWWDIATVETAKVMRSYLEHKNGLNLTVPNEEDLGLCTVCGCCIPLKVHTPIEHILKHRDPNQVFPDHCWINTP